VYEVFVGNQPTVGADYGDEQNNLESGKASEADKSALAAIHRALRMAGGVR